MEHKVASAVPRWVTTARTTTRAAPGVEGKPVLGALTAHRIEERTVREAVLRAGFRFAADAGDLRNPSDRRDPFCLRFVRPRAP